MPAQYFYIAEDENVLAKRRAPATYAIALLVAPFAALALVLGALLVARALLPPIAEIVPAWAPWTAWGALMVALSLAAWRRAATTEYVLTDQRVYARVGRFVTKLHFTTHDKVTDIRYRQGPLERAFGFASLTFATAGGVVHLAAVVDAMSLKAASERARDAFVRELLGEEEPRAPAVDGVETSQDQGPTPAAPPWTGPRPSYLQQGDTPVWFEKPRAIAAVGALRSSVGLLPLLLFSNIVAPSRRPWVLLGAFGLVLIFIAVRLMQLRRTEYVATDRRVYGRRGLVGTTVGQLTYDKITDITYHQDLLGRLFGYGSVTVQTAGGNQAPITMVGLADPLGAKETIERWRDASLRRSL